jgi:hypothetical protein
LKLNGTDIDKREPLVKKTKRLPNFITKKKTEKEKLFLTILFCKCPTKKSLECNFDWSKSHRKQN